MFGQVTFIGNKKLKRLVVAVLNSTGKSFAMAQQLVFMRIDEQAEVPLNQKNTDAGNSTITCLLRQQLKLHVITIFRQFTCIICIILILETKSRFSLNTCKEAVAKLCYEVALIATAGYQPLDV